MAYDKKAPRIRKDNRKGKTEHRLQNSHQDKKKTYVNENKPNFKADLSFIEEKEELNPWHDDCFVLEGRNVILEALKTDKPVDKILVARGQISGSALKIVAIAKDKGIVIQEVSRDRLDEMSKTKNHQGVMAYVAAQSYVEIDDILQIAKDKGEPPFILVLDHIEDPFNLGAMIRTAEGAGMHGVIIPKKRASGMTPTVAKAAAGALSHMAIAQVSNISVALEKLKQEGLWIYCAHGEGKGLYGQKLSAPAAVVIGSEGHGVSELVRKNSDFFLSIPMSGQITSLNASVAAGLVLYEFVRQKQFPLVP